MRVALFTETFLPKWDGIANTLGYLLEHLAELGHKSLLFAPQGGPRRYARTPIVGVPSFRFPFYPGLKLPAPMAMLRKKMKVRYPVERKTKSRGVGPIKYISFVGRRRYPKKSPATAKTPPNMP